MEKLLCDSAGDALVLLSGTLPRVENPAAAHALVL
jgi:hypothetical protein